MFRRAVRVGSEIAYEVVVNCESGRWIDTIERGVVRFAEAARLIDLPRMYVDSAIENHLDARSKREPVGRLHYRDCEKRWARHIKQLIKEGPESEPEDEDVDQMAELRKAALNRGQPWP